MLLRNRTSPVWQVSNLTSTVAGINMTNIIIPYACNQPWMQHVVIDIQLNGIMTLTNGKSQSQVIMTCHNILHCWSVLNLFACISYPKGLQCKSVKRKLASWGPTTFIWLIMAVHLIPTTNWPSKSKFKNVEILLFSLCRYSLWMLLQKLTTELTEGKRQCMLQNCESAYIKKKQNKHDYLLLNHVSVCDDHTIYC